MAALAGLLEPPPGRPRASAPWVRGLPPRWEASRGRRGLEWGSCLRFVATTLACCRQSVTKVIPAGRVCGAWRSGVTAAPEVEVGPYRGREPQWKKALNHCMKAEILDKSKLATEAYRSLERNEHGSRSHKAPKGPARLWGSCTVSEWLDPWLAAQGWASSWGSAPVGVFSHSSIFVLFFLFFFFPGRLLFDS